MMTENMTTWRDDEETILDSDIWGVAKNLTPYDSPEEELEAWKKTVKVLDHLCNVAEALWLDPLLLALVDAKSRAEDERERAVDRARRPAGELTSREESTLRGLMTRADALSNAYMALKARRTDYPENVAPYLDVMRELKDDAHEQFVRYRREVGLPDA